MPRTKITSAFKVPRQVTGQQGSSGKDEAEVSLVTGRRHRKDNSEWGKRMEKELAQIEKRTEAAVKKTASTKDCEREADVGVQKAIELPIIETIEKENLGASSSTEPKASNKHTSALGKRVAKDFGKLGVFFGVVQSVEYDTDDAGEEKPFYVVEYTDGDREDYSDNELEFACELALQISMNEEDDTQMSEAHTSSGESESYRPPKVSCH
jgi:hypothetical protein